jgi:hypothetical protein
MSESEFVVRAAFSDRTVRVYQAYRLEIATAAMKAGTFVPPFSMTRMTWIKPSFHWMMYRCGHATKPGQEVVLGIDVAREGLDWALRNAVLSSFNPSIHGSHEAWQHQLSIKPVRIQWDPERDWKQRLVPGVRAIQIGLGGDRERCADTRSAGRATVSVGRGDGSRDLPALT